MNYAYVHKRDKEWPTQNVKCEIRVEGKMWYEGEMEDKMLFRKNATPFSNFGNTSPLRELCMYYFCLNLLRDLPFYNQQLIGLHLILFLFTF